MKKFLVVLLALAMILAIASTAMAADTKIPDYNDTKTSTEYANDIYRLTALGVLEGNTGWGGAYRPADNLTRAEFAKIACFMFGKQSQVNYYKAQPSAFSDVEEGFWAEGWINCANDNGLMIGIGGGKFAPQANVTKQEVATVVLRAVGYTDELPGAWPADYIAKSQKVIAPFASETLFDYVEIIDGTAATRAEMAAIVNYALDLYRVAPAGNQLIVNGISDADADGYLYKALKTNEADIYNFFLGVDIKDAKIEIPLAGPNGPKVTLTVDPNLTTRETLLWDVFHAFEIPYLFERWASFGPAENLQYVEASGWGYEDFKKGELVFGDALTNERFSGYPGAGLRAQQKELVPTGLLIPVASDYYIFDDCLDGELWQLGGRLANLTLTVDVSKIDVLKKAIKAMNGPTAPGFLAKGVEAVYAEMLADVTYIDEETEVKDFYDEKVKVDNADIYSLDLDGFIGANLNGNYDIYDYDWFLDDQIGIVKKVADDKVTVDNLNFGDKKEAGVFCLLGDDCKKKHDLKYVFLKDNKLQDASCLKLNDVLYKAGYLAENEVALYIVYTPKAATLDELSRKSEKHPTAHMIISGDEYGWCTNDIAHQVSYDGGYTGGEYEGIDYDDIKEYAGEDCLFAPGYGKKYVATIIFAADDIHFGVLDGLKAEHEYDEPDDYFAVGAKIYGVDGEKDEDTEYAVSQKFNVGNKNNTDIPSAKRYYGWLGNFELNDKGKIKIADKSLTNGVLTDPSKSGIGVPNGDDTGFVPLAPASDPITINTNDNGVLSKVAIEDIDALNALIEAKYPDEYLKHAGKSMKITEDTIIYEITTDPDPIESEEEDTQEEDTQKGTDEENAEDEAEITLAEEFAFDSVKLGDPKDYIGKEFSCNQFSIFAWSGNEITVLYVVNPHFHGDIIMGLFDTQHVDGEGDFAKYEDGTKIYFNEDIAEAEIEKLTDHDLVYALYKTKNDEIFKVFAGNEEAPSKDALAAGDFVALVVANGFALKGDPTSAAILGSTDADSAKALLLEYTDDAYEVSDVVKITDQFLDEEDFMDKFTDDTEFIDMTGDGDFYDANDFHAGDDYGYIFVVDEFNEVLKVFRVDPTLKPGDEDAELPVSWDFGTAWDFFEDLFD